MFVQPARNLGRDSAPKLSTRAAAAPFSHPWGKLVPRWWSIRGAGHRYSRRVRIMCVIVNRRAKLHDPRICARSCSLERSAAFLKETEIHPAATAIRFAASLFLGAVPLYINAKTRSSFPRIFCVDAVQYNVACEIASQLGTLYGLLCGGL